MVKQDSILDDRCDWWCLASSKIMPSLEDLHYAIRLKDTRKVKLLTSYSSIRIDSSLRSCTALSLAVYEGELMIVKILLDTGRANVDKLSCDSSGRLETPLFSACRLGRKEIAVLLIEYGADVNTVDFYMHSPLWISTRERHEDLVQILIKNGAYLNSVDKYSQCPLYIATKFNGRVNLAKGLIRHGCKIDLTDADGRGALYWSFINRQFDIFKMLLDAGAHINHKTKAFLMQTANDDLDENERIFRNLLIQRLINCATLYQLARNAVRNRMITVSGGTSIWTSIDQLNVPEKIRKELKLIEISLHVQ
uniref:Uncharacterized protein n=1 Tax=Romanomermis culicivorax TaxID=13658 RepID=A0A915IPA7_ROMCU